MRVNASSINPRMAAYTAIALCLPLGLVMLTATFEIQPFDSFFRSSAAAQRIGSLVALTAVLLLPVAFLVNLLPTIIRLRTERQTPYQPAFMTLAVGVLILTGTLFLTGVFVADQLPCWQGVPNCD